MPADIGPSEVDHLLNSRGYICTAFPEKWSDIVNRIAEPADSDTRLPLESIGRALETLSCKSIVVEEDYYDKHYLSEYQGFHCKANVPPPARCARLHFFKSIISIKDVYAIDLGGHRESYLGYAVIRPTGIHRLGRALFQRPFRDKGVVTCDVDDRLADLGASIAGTSLRVHGGFPFTSKDANTMMCAQAALWMFLQHGKTLGHVRASLPSEIRELGMQSLSGAIADLVRPGTGMVQEQFVSTLTLAGLVPTPIPFSGKREDIGTAVCPYLAGGLPVIALLQRCMGWRCGKYQYIRREKWRDADDRLGHAFVVIGYRDSEPLTSMLPRELPNLTFWDAYSGIDRLIRHDDRVGPYLDCQWEYDEKRRWDYVLSEAEQFLVALPENVFVPADTAQRFAAEHLATIHEYTPTQSPHLSAFLATRQAPGLILRTVLARSNEFKAYAKEQSIGMSNEVRRYYLWTEMPKFMWVVEVQSIGSHKSKKAIGEILIDATSGARPSLLSAHVPGLLTCTDVLFSNLTAGDKGHEPLQITRPLVRIPIRPEHLYESFYDYTIKKKAACANGMP